MDHASGRNIVLYGAGGHARVCLDVLLDRRDVVVLAAVSDTGSGVDGLGVPVVTSVDDVPGITQSGMSTTFCVAIGDNGVRQQIGKKLTESGHLLTQVVSPHAVVSERAVLGAGVQILPGAIVMAAASLGDGVIVNTNASVDHDCTIGEYVHVAPAVAIAGGVTVGPRTLVGMGALVIPGVTIGADVVVGAGAVVIDDVPDGVTVVGVPARVVARTAPARHASASVDPEA